MEPVTSSSAAWTNTPLCPSSWFLTSTGKPALYSRPVALTLCSCLGKLLNHTVQHHFTACLEDLYRHTIFGSQLTTQPGTVMVLHNWVPLTSCPSPGACKRQTTAKPHIVVILGLLNPFTVSGRDAPQVSAWCPKYEGRNIVSYLTMTASGT